MWADARGAIQAATRLGFGRGASVFKEPEAPGHGRCCVVYFVERVDSRRRQLEDEHRHDVTVRQAEVGASWPFRGGCTCGWRSGARARSEATADAQSHVDRYTHFPHSVTQA